MSNTGSLASKASNAQKIVVHSAEYGTDGEVYAENGIYILHFSYKGQEFRSAICDVGKDTDIFINTIALWAMEDMIVDKKLEDAYAIYTKKEK